MNRVPSVLIRPLDLVFECFLGIGEKCSDQSSPQGNSRHPVLLYYFGLAITITLRCIAENSDHELYQAASRASNDHNLWVKPAKPVLVTRRPPDGPNQHQPCVGSLSRIVRKTLTAPTAVADRLSNTGSARKSPGNFLASFPAVLTETGAHPFCSNCPRDSGSQTNPKSPSMRLPIQGRSMAPLPRRRDILIQLLQVILSIPADRRDHRGAANPSELAVCSWDRVCVWFSAP